jgi:hypothetical protein
MKISKTQALQRDLRFLAFAQVIVGAPSCGRTTNRLYFSKWKA